MQEWKGLSLFCTLSSRWGTDTTVYQDGKNIFSYGVSQYDKNSAYTMSFNVSEEKEWMAQYKKISNEVES